MRCEAKLGRDGVWYARPYLGTDAAGRKIRPYRSFPSAKTREEAQAMADTWAASLTADGRVASARLADLLDDYVDMRERFGASPNTARTWRNFASLVARFAGRSALARDFSTADANRLERRLAAPKSEGGAGLSPSTVLGLHYFLRGAFSHLVAAGVCETNPMVCAAKPSPPRTDAPSIDEWDLGRVEEALRSAMEGASGGRAALRRASCAAAAWISLRTGLRCGEACALRRRDLSRSRPALRVGGTVIEQKGRPPYRRDVTKGRKSRVVAVTEREVEAIDALERAQDALLGPLPPDAPIVTADGSFMRPTAVSAAFASVRAGLGLPKGLTFHSLRHTHACWWIAQGGDLKSLSERLGHADEATTLRVYAHAMPGRDAAFARAVSDAMERAR